MNVCRFMITPAVRLCVIFLLLIAACGTGPAEQRTFSKSGLIMGTIVEVTISGSDREKSMDDMDAALREIERLDKLLGNYDQSGDIGLLNEAGYPGGVQVSKEVFSLLERARLISKETAGAFDITVGGLMRLWSFEKSHSVPEDQSLDLALNGVGWEKMILDEENNRIILDHPRTNIDLGGIGKGYAVDAAYRILRDRGVEAGIINAGGDLRVWGENPIRSGPWVIGIQHPRKPDELLGVMKLTDTALVTSGDYEKNFMIEDKLYHHILDPVTGYPTEGIQSVTVAAGTVEKADAYATALMVMGPKKAERFMAGIPGTEYIIVDSNGGILLSQGLKSVFQEKK